MRGYSDTINCKLVNMRIKETPLVLANTLFKVVENSDIEGYWLDSTGEIHFDYIEPETYFAIDSYYFRLAVKRLIDSGELCVFYKNFKNQGVLEYANGKEEILRERIEIIEESKPSEDYIRELLKRHGGLTIYKLAENCYLIEIYKERSI